MTRLFGTLDFIFVSLFGFFPQIAEAKHSSKVTLFVDNSVLFTFFLTDFVLISNRVFLTQNPLKVVKNFK